MVSSRDMFIEIESSHLQKDGNTACGDVFFSKKIKQEERTIAVLSDGLGSGIKANVLATMTSSMLLNFALNDEPILRAASIIQDTLPVDSVRQISYAAFSMVDIDSGAHTRIIEYGNPTAFIIRDNRIVEPEIKKIELEYIKGCPHPMLFYSFDASIEDRLVLFSDGVTQSGMGREGMPFGWGRKRFRDYLLNTVCRHPDISAKELTKRITGRASLNDFHKRIDDISASVIYFRNPRKTVIATGPPYDKHKDKYITRFLKNFDGNKIIAGGTTAAIVARELDTDISIDRATFRKELPPASKINGIDLVTEGILTLGKTAKFLENNCIVDLEDPDCPAQRMLKLLLDSDKIHFIVGTRINEAHHDPALPVELEIRRNVVKKVTRLLEEKYLKNVSVEYV